MIINSLQEFCKFFYHNQPIIAIDYGIKKLGIAISSPDHKIAMPFKMITATNKKEQIATVLSLLKEKQICGIIVGLPVNIDGSHCVNVRKRSFLVSSIDNTISFLTPWELLPLSHPVRKRSWMFCCALNLIYVTFVSCCSSIMIGRCH